MRLSLILPAYNEQENIRKNLPLIYAEVQKIGDSEIIVTEDGSSDKTAYFARQFARRVKNVRVLSFKKNVGKGFAIKKAIAAARGDVIGYTDIDLAVPASYIGKALSLVESGNQLVFGSRYNSKSRTKRAPMRLLGSVAYNLMVITVLGSRASDHMCGFKFWEARLIKEMLPLIRDDRWFFDTEILVLAQRKGIRPLSMPVAWVEVDSTVPPGSDMVYLTKEVIKLRFRKD